ncbi:MAG: bifunctional folylpolyglutamate synthase/dihydrofolate synthase, partial [Deltaproteobacteria bacterium]|nr:bifunctional folylpolyglutamate synthase/dihydrofolate synthase [Deltaproteobacteria bacterium]
VLVPPPISRALDPQTLAGPGDTIARDIKEGLSLAIDIAGNSDTILVTGSLFTMAAVRAAVLDEPTDPPIGL